MAPTTIIIVVIAIGTFFLMPSKHMKRTLMEAAPLHFLILIALIETMEKVIYLLIILEIGLV